MLRRKRLIAEFPQVSEHGHGLTLPLGLPLRAGLVTCFLFELYP